MEKEYDLAKLAEDLASEIPGISELYLFGSRARSTKSIRSDVDILVVTAGHIQPQVLRDFSHENCKALDLFIVDGGKAISSSNESFIEADDLSSLVELLGAIKIWSRAGGRAKADIEWRFKLREDVEYPATALPNTHVNPIAPLDPSRLTLLQISSSLTTPQLWKMGTAIFSVLVGVFLLGFRIGSN